tara:strand:+ start:3996 stop:4361 length:366 start_codon:yes stop_codon:yes gene_type:complete
MTYTKPLLAGAAIFLAGYCTGTSIREQPTLETKIQEVNPKNNKTLIDFLKQHQGKTQPTKQKKQDYFQTLWDNLPEKTKTDLIKHVAKTQLKKYYQEAKEQSATMYEELKHYFDKKLGKEE